MGIDLWNFQFLLSAYVERGPFGKTVQIGRQEIHMGEGDYPLADRFLKEAGFDLSFREARRDTRYADEALLPLLGAHGIETADASAYEGADIVHDFNDPLPEAYYQKFDTLFDGGSLEHIFNVPVALANEMHMLKVGGYLLSSLPANNWLGHGFYQFSQELPFRTLTPANGFDLRAVMYSGLASDHQLYRLDDRHRRAGAEIGRTDASNGIMFIGCKTAQTVPFRRWPQQGTMPANGKSLVMCPQALARHRRKRGGPVMESAYLAGSVILSVKAKSSLSRLSVARQHDPHRPDHEAYWEQEVAS